MKVCLPSVTLFLSCRLSTGSGQKLVNSPPRILLNKRKRTGHERPADPDTLNIPAGPLKMEAFRVKKKLIRD